MYVYDFWLAMIPTDRFNVSCLKVQAQRLPADIISPGRSISAEADKWSGWPPLTQRAWGRLTEQLAASFWPKTDIVRNRRMTDNLATFDHLFTNHYAPHLRQNGVTAEKFYADFPHFCRVVKLVHQYSEVCPLIVLNVPRDTLKCARKFGH